VCSDDNDPECGFHCECPESSAGHRCNVYRRCFAETRVCYQTDYVRGDYHHATQHCLHQGNLTKPIILNRHEAANLKTFIERDPAKLLTNDSIWLAGQTKRIPQTTGDSNSSGDVYWEWIDGLNTCTPNSHSLTSYWLLFVQLQPSCDIVNIASTMAALTAGYIRPLTLESSMIV